VHLQAVQILYRTLELVLVRIALILKLFLLLSLVLFRMLLLGCMIRRGVLQG